MSETNGVAVLSQDQWQRTGPGRPRKFSPLECRDLREMHEQHGYSVGALARMFDVGYLVMRSSILRVGGTIRNDLRAPRRRYAQTA